MKKIKEILAFTIISLFIIIALSPTINANDVVKQRIQISYVGENGELFYKEVSVNVEDLEEFQDSWDSWEGLLKDIRSDNKLEFEEIKSMEQESLSMLEELKDLTYDGESGSYLFPNINLPQFIHDSLYLIGGGTRIFSIGRGDAWVPFNRQGESFIGMRFLPIFIKQNIGFTRTRCFSLFPFARLILNRLFNHRVLAFGFTGLFIDFGRRFFDNTVGPIILIGKPNFISLGDDII